MIRDGHFTSLWLADAGSWAEVVQAAISRHIFLHPPPDDPAAAFVSRPQRRRERIPPAVLSGARVGTGHARTSRGRMNGIRRERAWGWALPLLLAAAGASAGCSWPTVNAGCANVPNPVLLSKVNRVAGHRSAEAPSVGKVDVEVEEVHTVTSHKEGNYQVTTHSWHKEGANKASFAVMTATQGKRDLDVHVDKISAGAYAQTPLFYVRTKTWVGVEGNAESAGAR